MKQPLTTCALVFVVLSTVAAAQSPGPPDPTVRAVSTLRGLRLLVEDSRTVDWAPRGDKIAYDRLDDTGYSRLYVASPDGTGQKCITCLPFEFRNRHAGNPVWHPSGRYIVFQLEKPFRLRGELMPFMAIPGRNLGDDLWAITPDGKRFWNLTYREDMGGRSLSPRFSPEGDLMVWSERIASGGGAWGQWVLRVGEFTEVRGTPRLKKIKSHKPGGSRVFFEAYGFSTDQKQILFASNLDPQRPESGMDLFAYELATGELTRLTDSRELWDRFGRFAPNGRWIAWASGRNQPGRPPTIERRDASAVIPSDLWLMSFPGRTLTRLTSFNDVFSPSYAGRVMVGAPTWSPQGDQLIVPVIPISSPRSPSLYQLELEEAFGR